MTTSYYGISETFLVLLEVLMQKVENSMGFLNRNNLKWMEALYRFQS